jgi:hypothetical protein
MIVMNWTKIESVKSATKYPSQSSKSDATSRDLHSVLPLFECPWPVDDRARSAIPRTDLGPRAVAAADRPRRTLSLVKMGSDGTQAEPGRHSGNTV